MTTVAKAIGRFVRVSPSKARLVADLIRGKRVAEALSLVQYSPQAAARLVEKVLRSAIANAEHNHQVRGFEDLRVSVVVDGGPTLRRVQPRAMGRAFWIRHRTSHITVALTEAGDGRPHPVAEPGPHRPATRRQPARPEAAPAAPPSSAKGGRRRPGSRKTRSR